VARLRLPGPPRWVFYPILVGAVAAACSSLGLDPSQTASAAVLTSLIMGSLFFWRFRVAFALAGVAVLLGLGLLDIPHLVEFAGLDIILFLIGMMLVVGFLEERRFFERIVDVLVFGLGSSAFRLTVLLMVLAAVFAALVDEVTSILFMSATVFMIAEKYRQDPVPFLIMVIFATNIGSSATVVGNPIGVMIALRAELTFTDFLRWATPIALAALLLSLWLLTRHFSRQIEDLNRALRDSDVSRPDFKGLLAPDMRLPWAVFLTTLAGLINHARLERLLHLEKNSLLLGVALFAGGVVLFLERERARALLERRVEWWTLSFFLLLFASVGTLKLTGVTGEIARGITGIAGDRAAVLFLIVTWVSGLLSAVMDNVLAVATFIPVIQDLAAAGADAFPLWWGLLFGGTFLGNLTVIGSTANIVAIGLLERRRLGHIGMGQWVRAAFIPGLLTLALACLLLLLQLFLL